LSVHFIDLIKQTRNSNNKLGLHACMSLKVTIASHRNNLVKINLQHVYLKH